MKKTCRTVLLVMCVIPLLLSCDIFQPPFDPVAFFSPMYNAFRNLVQTTPLPEIVVSYLSEGHTLEEWMSSETMRTNGPIIPQSVKDFAAQYIHLGGAATRAGETYEFAEYLLYMICAIYNNVTQYGINEGVLPVTMEARSTIYQGNRLPAYLRTVYFSDMVFRMNPLVHENHFVTASLPLLKFGDKPYIMTVWDNDLPNGSLFDLSVFPIPIVLLFF